MNVSYEPKRVPERQRQNLPDQLRGLALLGILLVNMGYLALSNDGISSKVVHNQSDIVVAFLSIAFAQSKFYLLFSFLFGYSLTLMLKKSENQIRVGQYQRRLWGLAVLGLLHAIFLFIGDILFQYALLGLPLLWFIRYSNQTILISAGISYVLGCLLLFMVVVVGLEEPQSQIIGNSATLDMALQQGGFLEVAAARLNAFPEVLFSLGLVTWPFVFCMFLLGLVSGRKGLLAQWHQYTSLWNKLLWLAVLVGLPTQLITAWLSLFTDSEIYELLGLLLGFSTGPVLAAGYLALVVKATSFAFLKWIEPAGQMSLTVYLGQSIVFSLLFCGWGFGLYGQLSLAFVGLLATVLWLLQVVFARWWLAHFCYGPFEWLLRSWTKKKWVKLGRPNKKPLAESQRP